jgi:SulP family sulfate permease
MKHVGHFFRTKNLGQIPMKFVHGLHYNNIRGDIYGGITAGIVALPLALAFGVSSGAGAIAGVYGAIFVGMFAALFGGTPTQVSGPTGPMTVVMAAIFTQFTAMFPSDPATGAALAFTVVIMGGLFQILFGIFKLGKFINLVPHPVISGFMSGIGVIIILLQVAPLLGHVQQSSPMAAAQIIPAAISDPIQLAMVIGLISLAIGYFLPNKINRILPSPLVALIVGTLVLLFYAGNDITSQMVDGKKLFFIEGVRILGDIPTGFPTPLLPTLIMDWDILIEMVKAGLMLAALGSIDSLLTSLVADNMTRTHHESDRELIGQGIGNSIAGMFGGLPGAGATMRTVINIRSGGKTPLSGALHAIFLLVIVLGAGVLAQYIPHAVLAGILIKVGYDIIDWDYLRRLRHVPKPGVVLMFTVLFTTVFVDLITAVAIGMIMASMVFMKRMTDLELENIKAISEPDEECPLSAEEKELHAQTGGRLLHFQLGGPIIFCDAKGIVRRLSWIGTY